MKVFGTAEPTAKDAASKLAMFMDQLWELPSAAPHQPPRASVDPEVARARRLEALIREAHGLLGLKPMTQEQHESEERAFCVWQSAGHGMAEVCVVPDDTPVTAGATVLM